MKRIIALLLICLLVCSGTTVFGNDNLNLSHDEEYMVNVILSNSNVEVFPTDSYSILDIAGNPTYICVEFNTPDDKQGFGIIDLCSYDVVMYTLASDIPFSSEDIIVYDGGLQFARINNDGSATVLNTGTIISADLLFDKNYIRSYVVSDDIKFERINQEIDLLNNNQVRSSEVLINGGSDTTLVYSAGNNSSPWTTDCGINAAAIFLRHMDNYFDNNYVPNTQNTENSLKIALAARAHSLLGHTTSLTMDEIASLANSYMDAYSGSGVSHVTNRTYSWLKYYLRIMNGLGMPCILCIEAGTTSYWSSAHAVVGVGYTSGATATSGYIIVNSGWISLGYVYIGTSIPSYIIY
ncbi:MAG: hypothetical protein IKU06_09570 [Lachnospiraceae bacterium]|nr:hypothetical protein [Lachnospiraceae bacterium]